MLDQLSGYFMTVLDQYPKSSASRNVSYLLEAILICILTFVWLEFAEMGDLYHWLYPMIASCIMVIGHFLITESAFILFKFKGIKIGRFWLTSLLGIIASFCLVYLLGLCGFVCRVIGSYCPIDWHTSPPDIIGVFFRTVIISWGISTYLMVQVCLKKQLEKELIEIKTINRVLKQKSLEMDNEKESKKKDTSSKLFPFTFSNRQNNLLLQDIRYISVEDHYCKVVYHDNGSIKEEMLRLSLKEALNNLPESDFAQVHRSIIVNLSFVRAIKRKGQAYSISLADIEHSLPASRHRAREFLPKLKHILN